jgi:hypothetical protein
VVSSGHSLDGVLLSVPIAEFVNGGNEGGDMWVSYVILYQDGFRWRI